MADITASIIGIASFGIKITRTLYQFGADFSGAREETSYIARHVDLYSSALEVLSDRIKQKEAILSRKAYDLVKELTAQSHQLFNKIRDLIPRRGRDDPTFWEKVKWNFRKPKANLLVAELEHLKSTVLLLVSVMFAGKKIRSYKLVAFAHKYMLFADVKFKQKDSQATQREPWTRTR